MHPTQKAQAIAHESATIGQRIVLITSNPALVRDWLEAAHHHPTVASIRYGQGSQAIHYRSGGAILIRTTPHALRGQPADLIIIDTHTDVHTARQAAQAHRARLIDTDGNLLHSPS